MFKDIKKYLFKKQIERLIAGIAAQLVSMMPSLLLLVYDSKTTKYIAILFLILPSVFTIAAIIKAKIKYQKMLGVLGVTNEEETELYLERSDKLSNAKNVYTFLNDGLVFDFTNLKYFYIRDIQKMIKGSFNEYYGSNDSETRSTTETVTVYEIKISLNKHDGATRKYRLRFKSFIERDAVFINLANAYSEYGDPNSIFSD